MAYHSDSESPRHAAADPAGKMGGCVHVARVVLLLAVLAFVAGGLLACRGEPTEQGVAARVNGKPLPVKVLEFEHGLLPPGDKTASDGAEARLKTEYGDVLARLIVEELVAQELARRGMEVTSAELRNAETSVRSGYPGKTFENTLAEEGIDLDVWRERLRARLNLEKFSARVLRPKVGITSEEAQSYYKSHVQEFVQPAGVKFLVVESKNPDSLLKALNAAAKAKDPADLLSVFEDVSSQTLAAPLESLPRARQAALKDLKPGQPGPISQSGTLNQAFILLERTESRVEGLVQVYPLVEKRLIEDKMNQQFSAWLAKTLDSAVIEVNPELIPEKGKS